MTRERPLDGPPVPDADAMALDTLRVSVWTAVSLVLSTIVLGTLGSLGVSLGRAVAEGIGARIGLGVGLGIGAMVIALLLRRFSLDLLARSASMYRGAWIGMWLALGLIVAMAYFPGIAFPTV